MNGKIMKKYITYKQAGVDIKAGEHSVNMITSHICNTQDTRVIHMRNGFAGLFQLDFDDLTLFKNNYKNPVPVACTDGVDEGLNGIPTTLEI